MTGTALCRVLGPVRVDGAEGPIGSPQQRLVLAALALAEGHVVSTGRLVAAVWGDRPPPSAVVTVRTYVSRLRAALGRSMVDTIGDGYRLRDMAVDVAVARDLEAESRTTERGRARRLLDRAVALWTAEPLAGLSGGWVEAHRLRLSDWRTTLIERRAVLDLELGDTAAVIDALVPLCHRLPLREPARRALMSALYRTGRRAEAIECFEDYRRRLDAELGARPGTGITELYRDMLRAEVVVTGTGPATTAPRPAPLPRTGGDFVGRRREMRILCDALQPGRGTAEVATLTGMPGIGTTALATRVAGLVGDRFDHPPLFARLHGSADRPADPGRVLSELLQDMGIETATIPDDVDGRVGLYRSVLAERGALVVLDDAADSRQLVPLLPGDGGSAALVTGRALTPGPRHDRYVTLSPLSGAESSELLGRILGPDRVAADRAAVRAIVAGCAGLPAALRIVADRAVEQPDRALAEVAAALHDPDRCPAELCFDGRDLAADIAVSRRRLAAEPDAVFGRLARHGGPNWTTADVAAALGVDSTAARDWLEQLVDAHLLGSPAPDRYRYHRLVWCCVRACG